MKVLKSAEQKNAPLSMEMYIKEDIENLAYQELKELRASLETINKTSSELITDIDRNYAEIMKEREAEMAMETEEKPLEEMNILEMVDYFMEQGMTEEQANDLAHAEWQARDVRQRGNDVVQKEMNTD